MLFQKQPLINPWTSNWFCFAGLVWWIHYARVGPLLFGWELSLTFSDLLIIIAWHATHLQLFSGTLLKKRISFFCLNGIAYNFYFIIMPSLIDWGQILFMEMLVSNHKKLYCWRLYYFKTGYILRCMRLIRFMDLYMFFLNM